MRALRLIRMQLVYHHPFYGEDNISLPTSWIGYNDKELYDELIMMILTYATVLVWYCRMIRIES